MTFVIHERPSLRAEVAKNIREGCHHKKGEHTLLDMTREYAAERVEHTGTAESIVGCTITGYSHHAEDGTTEILTVTVQTYLAHPDDAGQWDKNRAVLQQHGAEVFEQHGAEMFDNTPTN